MAKDMIYHCVAKISLEHVECILFPGKFQLSLIRMDIYLIIPLELILLNNTLISKYPILFQRSALLVLSS